MDFISNSEFQNKEMLKKIGVQSVEELFSAIPKSLLIPKPKQDDGLSEMEGLKLMEALSTKNTFSHYDNYIGAGAYEHYVPALVSAICSKSEFLTSYTPYQPEASQGMLQTIFEFQSAICALTGLDVANASLYDGASACAEALLMGLRLNKNRTAVLVAGNLNPHYRAVVEQYLCHPEIEIKTIPILSNGLLDQIKFREIIDENCAAMILQYPNFFGSIDAIKEVCTAAKEKGIVTIVSANPLVYGLFATASELAVDIAVGDCQPLGVPLQFGGPYAGYMACRQEYVRQLPGRIVGQTTDMQGKKGFVLTLQAREQHIRREKATSNICTNQALNALASLIAILWYGKEGLKKLALTNYQRAAYLRAQLASICAETSFSQTHHFNEFVVKFNCPSKTVFDHFRKFHIEPGLDLGRFFPQFKDHLLVAVTETKSEEQLERYIKAAQELM